jgi:hypothetical protein
MRCGERSTAAALSAPTINTLSVPRQHRTRGNHEHSWTLASLGVLRFTGQPET